MGIDQGGVQFLSRFHTHLCGITVIGIVRTRTHQDHPLNDVTNPIASFTSSRLNQGHRSHGIALDSPGVLVQTHGIASGTDLALVVGKMWEVGGHHLLATGVSICFSTTPMPGPGSRFVPVLRGSDRPTF